MRQIGFDEDDTHDQGALIDINLSIQAKSTQQGGFDIVLNG